MERTERLYRPKTKIFCGATKSRQFQLSLFFRQISSSSFNEENNPEFNQITKIMQLFYSMANLDARALSQDSCLIKQWLEFNKNVPAKQFYLYVSTL